MSELYSRKSKPITYRAGNELDDLFKFKKELWENIAFRQNKIAIHEYIDH